ncbi:MAG: helix-turn-helix transcriptional regulator [Cyclobacteriaceae bacterium]
MKDAKDEDVFVAHAREALKNRIKELRKSKGYSSADLFAYDNNISRGQYGRYERGEDIRFSTLAKLIHTFDLTVEEFFAEGFKLEE